MIVKLCAILNQRPEVQRLSWRKALSRIYKREDFAVGWIRAIAIKHIAAQAVLDGKYHQPEHVYPHGYNDYTLGRIWRHNVVICE